MQVVYKCFITEHLSVNKCASNGKYYKSKMSIINVQVLAVNWNEWYNKVNNKKIAAAVPNSRSPVRKQRLIHYAK